MIKKLFAVLVVSCLVGSCQDDSISESTEALEESSELTTVLKSMTVNETDIDDFLDSTSCYKVQLPVQVLANGHRMKIFDEGDYAAVLTVLEAGGDYTGEVEFTYPLTLQNKDYEEVVVNSPEELNTLKALCTEVLQNYIGDNCVEIVYPVTLYNYNSGFQMQGTYIANNNKELYTVIKNLGTKEYYSVKYPVLLKMSKGIITEVKNNEALLEAINNALLVCGQQG